MIAPTRVAACQLPEIREDVESALACIQSYGDSAASAGAQLVCFPECFLQGYLTDQLAYRHALDLASSQFQAVMDRLAVIEPVLVFGVIEEDAGQLFNTAVVVAHGQLLGRYRKQHLLKGEVVFTPGTSCPVFDLDEIKFGINICYDTNFPEAGAAIAVQGARLIVCPSNNMMRRPKAELLKHRHNEVRSLRAKETGLWFMSSDVTGDRGDAISYGPTCVINPQGDVIAQVPLSEVGMVVVDIE